MHARMMRAAVCVGVVLALAALAVAVAHPAGAGASVTRTFDETLVCATTFEGGARSISAKAHRGTGRQGSRWNRPAYASFTTGQVGSQFTLLDNQLAWVTAGRAMPDSTVLQATFAGIEYPLRTWGTIAWNARLCRPHAKAALLSAVGVSGGLAGPFEEEFDCFAPRRVVLRVRAMLGAAAKPTHYKQFIRLTAPVSKATIVARTESGKSLALAEVLESGKARLLTAPGCVPD
jgi:hypothetical protein